MLNDRQDYFGQTVNVASRVQGLADSKAIFTTDSVVRHPEVARILDKRGLSPRSAERLVRGVADRITVYEIP